MSGIDPRRSQCFPQDNGTSVGGIRINLVGREPDGVVTPGRQMDTLCSDLRRELLDIVDRDTGRPAVKAVTRTSELYRGEYLEHLPDLLVEWSDETPVGSLATGNLKGCTVRLFSPKVGTVEGAYTYCRTGDHRPEGLFVALGPGVKPARLKRTVSIMDFAPTFARLLGVELSEVDGKPIPEITVGGPGLPDPMTEPD